MQKINIQKFVGQVAEHVGESAETVLLVAINDGDAQSALSGADNSYTDNNAVALAATLEFLLDTKLKAALALYHRLNETGVQACFSEMVSNVYGDTICNKAAEKPDPQTEQTRKGSNKKEKPENTSEEIRGEIENLLKLIGRALGGDDDADDD